MKILSEESDKAKRLELIDTLRTITLGKIFVECERARLTQILARIKEREDGDPKEAARLMFELQVETFGSMEQSEKLDFLLDQMRLGLLTNELSKTQITARKISPKHLEPEEYQGRKLEYHEMMVRLALNDKDYLQVAKYYQHIYDTPVIQKDEAKCLDILKNVVMFAVLAPFDNEQSDLVHRLRQDERLDKIALYKNLLVCFLTKELMRWPIIQDAYYPTLALSLAFSKDTPEGAARWVVFRDRVCEHNIRIIASYYRRISLQRMTILLDSDVKSTEESLAKLVVNKTIYAKLDRPAGIVRFLPRQDPSAVLNEWSGRVSHLLNLVVRVNHLIAKEEMLHALATK